ncbi:MAG: YgiQ family radical SAM protein [Ignavibacteria bacterium GWF2_33_9]|nr:MAG: YgiQ family radical SAM protein [Ignavibacteria bacterium GWF2_33_9]
MFLPTTKQDINKLGWQKLDVIIVTGDVYIDSYYDGAAVIGRVLESQGWKVGIISQPDLENDDIMKLGEPRLFWGVTAGCVDSMVANYTALKKKKRSDDLTPGGENNRRPDRATIIYTNLIRRLFKNTVPIILGGIEASLRRIAHYDYWSDKIRRSVLFDAKADALVYGMGEKTIIEIADKISKNENWKDIRGLCYTASENLPKDYIEIPSFDEASKDKVKFAEMFETFYKNNDAFNAKGLLQKYDNRYLVQNPPQFLPSSEELDKIYSLPFKRDAHPFYKEQGKIKALETIQFSITSHRGCYGECNFCSIAVHQGRRIVSRSIDSILEDAKEITKQKDFKGYISDIGGPTANMFDSGCKVRNDKELCPDKRCVYPTVCKALINNHNSQTELLEKIRKINGIKKVFVSSGIRYDLIVEDKKNGERYLYDIVQHHVSGQMKIAPEHTNNNVLDIMGKNETYLIEFKKKFDELSKKIGKKQFLTYYFIAAHPGCSEGEMKELSNFLRDELRINPEQVQIFTPTPSTYSTLMYYTGFNPLSDKKVFVERDLVKKRRQKEIINNKIHVLHTNKKNTSKSYKSKFNDSF